MSNRSDQYYLTGFRASYRSKQNNRLSPEFYKGYEGLGMLMIGQPVAYVIDILCAFTTTLDYFSFLPVIIVHLWLWIGSYKCSLGFKDLWYSDLLSYISLTLLGLAPFIVWQKSSISLQYIISVIVFILLSSVYVWYIITLAFYVTQICCNESRELKIPYVIVKYISLTVGSLSAFMIFFSHIFPHFKMSIFDILAFMKILILIVGLVPIAVTSVILWRARKAIDQWAIHI